MCQDVVLVRGLNDQHEGDEIKFKNFALCIRRRECHELEVVHNTLHNSLSASIHRFTWSDPVVVLLTVSTGIAYCRINSLNFCSPCRSIITQNWTLVLSLICCFTSLSICLARSTSSDHARPCKVICRGPDHFDTAQVETDVCALQLTSSSPSFRFIQCVPSISWCSAFLDKHLPTMQRKS